MGRLLLFAFGFALSTSGALSAPANCGGAQSSSTYSGLRPFEADAAVGFVKRRLAVDADGAPNSYQVDGNGLSYTCDGVAAIVNGRALTTEDPGWQEACKSAWARARSTGDYSKLKIFGFAKNANNEPTIQKHGDPLPGVGFISETSVPVPDGAVGTQRRWIDANEIPYVVPGDSFRSAFGVSPADLVIVYRPSNGRAAFAVHGDCCGLGEGSVRLHYDLGGNPIAIRGGVKRAKVEIEGEPVLTLVFPGVHTTPTTDAAKWRAEIESKGRSALEAWGGVDRLRACAQ